MEHLWATTCVNSAFAQKDFYSADIGQGPGVVSLNSKAAEEYYRNNLGNQVY